MKSIEIVWVSDVTRGWRQFMMTYFGGVL